MAPYTWLPRDSPHVPAHHDPPRHIWPQRLSQTVRACTAVSKRCKRRSPLRPTVSKRSYRRPPLGSTVTQRCNRLGRIRLLSLAFKAERAHLPPSPIGTIRADAV